MVLVEDRERHDPNNQGRYASILSPWMAFLIPLVVYLLSLRWYDYSYGFNVLAAQYALWTTHSFSLGVANDSIAPMIPNIDIITYHGTYYTAYAPGLSLISLPFAVIGFALDGGKLLPSGDAMVMLEAFVALTGALASVLVYKICMLYSKRVLPSLLAALTLAFSTPAWAFASVIFPHDTTMFFALGGTYSILHYFRVNPRRRYLLFAGVCIGIVSTLDYVATILVIPIAIYILLQTASRRRVSMLVYGLKSTAAASGSRFLIFLFTFMATGPLVVLGYNESVFGNPFIFSEEFFTNVPSGNQNLVGLVSRFNLDGLPIQAVYNLISLYRGIFILSPILVLGLYGLYRMFRSHNLKLDGALFLSLFLCIYLPYSAWNDWAGGGSYGPRFLVAGLPFLTIPIIMIWSGASWSMRRRAYTGGLYFILFAIGAITQGMGAITNATPLTLEPGPPLVYQLTRFALPSLFKAQLGVWFLHRQYPHGNLPVDLAFTVILFGTILG
ncbi:MAG: glycosyltransferase family 39 protein, partial [Nitrososphaerales archaeon]